MADAADSPRRLPFHENTMNRLIVTGVAALFLVACSKESSAARTPVAANAKVTLELGQDISEACIANVHKALDKVPGVGEIAIKKGDKDFTVHYDNTKVQPDALVKALVAEGEKNAKVKS